MKQLLKKDQGNITILVLILAMVIFLGISSMIGFVFRDIQFTKIDEGNLRALNFAEAGAADFQYRLSLHLREGEALPQSSYTQSIMGADGEEGRFTVAFEEISEEGSLKGYEVVSEGTDKSDQQRTILVTFSVGGSSEISIYDFIYSDQTMMTADDSYIAGNTTFYGPFFTNGSIVDTEGTASLYTDPLYVGGDIQLSGSSMIDGEDGDPIDLYLGGAYHLGGSSYINYQEPVGAKVELPMPDIDTNYIQEIKNEANFLEINEDLTITEDGLSVSGTEEYLEFDDRDTLVVKKTIVVNGDLIIGTPGGPPMSTLRYKGNAKMIVDGNIYIKQPFHADDQFPQESLLVLMSTKNIHIGSRGGPQDLLNGEFVAVANNDITIEEENIHVKGTLIARKLILKDNVVIEYLDELSNFLPDDLPESSAVLSNRAILESWHEIPNQS